MTKAQRERVRRHAAMVAIAQRPTVSEDGSVGAGATGQSEAEAQRYLALRRWRGEDAESRIEPAQDRP